MRTSRCPTAPRYLWATRRTTKSRASRFRTCVVANGASESYAGAPFVVSYADPGVGAPSQNQKSRNLIFGNEAARLSIVRHQGLEPRTH
ncbi:hypothetical protein U2A4042190012 [Corynebacterium striatum]|nr:hypothetical protein U2A4042190012 [Corynebacterium striatum]